MSENPFSRLVGNDGADAVRELIAADPAPQPEESFWSKVDATLDQDALSEPVSDHSDPDSRQDAQVSSMRERRTRTRPRNFSIITAAAVLILVVGIAFMLGQRDPEPTNLNVASQPETSPTEPPASTGASAQEAPTPVAQESVEEAALRAEAQRLAYERLATRLTPEETAILENHGRAATGIYNVDGGLFFSLVDLAPYGDVTQEVETEQRVRCFLDGLARTMTADELVAPISIEEPLNAAALPAYLGCTPAHEVYDRFIGSFLWGHREYSNNVPPIEATDPCFAEVYGTPAEFVASLGDNFQSQRPSVIACVEARNGSSADSPQPVPPEAGSNVVVTDSPQFVPPEVAAGLTPVGYGDVVGLTADGSALYTVSTAPGREETCLESKVLQFYLQPLDGGPRVPAGSHQIDGEAVTEFASDGTHAVWVEFCEFSESVYVADIASDGSLFNSRVVTAISGENRVGSVFHLSLENGIAQAFIRPDDPPFDANGAAIEVFERLDVDLESDSLIARSSIGPSADVVDMPGTRTIREGQTRIIVLPDGRRMPFPDGNFGHTIAYDPSTDTLYTSLRADTPGDSIIVAHTTNAATAFRAVGLTDSERVLATLDDGQSWIISQTTDCRSTLVARSLDGQDRTILESAFPVDGLKLDAPTTWYARGWCEGSTVPAVQIGAVIRDANDQVVGLRSDLTVHIKVPNYAFSTATRPGDALTFTDIYGSSGSVTIGSNGELATGGAAVGSGWLVRTDPLPAVFELSDGWRSTHDGANGAVLTLSHASGAAVLVSADRDDNVAAAADMIGYGAADHPVPPEWFSQSETLTARVTEYRRESDGPVVSTEVHFTVAGTDVFVYASSPSESPEAELRIEEMLGTLRYVEPPETDS